MTEAAASWMPLLAAAVLSLIHLMAGRMTFLDRAPRSRWLSAAAGVSVAYVFVHLLPELAAAQESVDTGGGPLPSLENHAYLLALVGLALFYGVERASLASRHRSRGRAGADHTDAATFWLSTASFALYNALIGYLLVRGEAETAGSIALFTIALGVHFVINDFSLRDHHKDAYHQIARWLLAVAILVGWLVGSRTAISQQALGLVLAFIAGGVVLNVLKEELPGERQARFLPFAGAAATYAALLQVA